MANFNIYRTTTQSNNVELEKASATVIPAGSLVTLDAWGLAIVAVAASTAVAYTDSGAWDGDTKVSIIIDNDLILSGTWDRAFAKTDRAQEVDIDTTNQTIDLDASVTDVLRVLPSEDAWEVGSTDEILVKINKSLF